MDWWNKDPEPWSRNYEGEEVEDEKVVTPNQAIFRVCFFHSFSATFINFYFLVDQKY